MHSGEAWCSDNSDAFSRTRIHMGTSLWARCPKKGKREREGEREGERRACLCLGRGSDAVHGGAHRCVQGSYQPEKRAREREREGFSERSPRLFSSFSLACRKKSRPGFGAHGRSKPPDAADAAGLAVRAASSGRPSIPSGLRHIMKPGPEPARMPARMPESRRSSTDRTRFIVSLWGTFGPSPREAEPLAKPLSRLAALAPKASSWT